MTAPLLAVTSVGVVAARGNDRSTLVRDVDFVLNRGETLGVVGESGSGKSMLMKAVLGLLPHGVTATGEVRFDGRRIDGMDEREIRRLRGSRLSLLLQDPFTMLNPLQTVGATIAETLRPEDKRSRGQTRHEVERRLAEVGLQSELARKRPFQLSGGMRQRVAIAAALAANPELLIADEPTTALDVQTQADVLKLLKSLQARRGMALILITHDLRVAFDVCDHVMVMYAGTVLERARSADMRTAPLHPYTAALMAAEPPIDYWARDLNALPGSVPSADSVATTCAFASRCPWAEPVCTASAPALVPVAPDHTSRCLRVAALAPTLAQQVADATMDHAQPRQEPAQATAPPLLTVRGLAKTFHTASLVGSSQAHVALNRIDLDVWAGEAVGLVGDSGSGKTTIARSILGLSTPDEGAITLAGTDISNYRLLDRRTTLHIRRKVQVVFQDPYSSLNPSLTVGRTLREAIRARGGQHNLGAEVADVLNQVNLPGSYADRLPAGLSGGERQRVAIARALCLRPQLLICDEPVAALDVSVQAQVLELLRTLHAELGMAMLFITHDLAVVRQMTERVVVINRGEIVEAGPTDQVLQNPQHPYTRALIAAIPGHGRQPTVEADHDLKPTTIEGIEHDNHVERPV